jgi:hypothetical protein
VKDEPTTIGNSRHSAKALLHSAKGGPSAKFLSVKGSLSSAFYRALDKDFAECLQKLSAKKSCRDGDILTNGCFVECLQGRHSAKKLLFF